MPDVTQDDIFAAIIQAMHKGDTVAVTTEELAATLGRPSLAVRADLRKLMASGIIEVVRTRRVCLDGVSRLVPGYRPRA